jgi:sterol-4alpha-carboxylate 3-dehydrogenase (decarboxylating)
MAPQTPIASSLGHVLITGGCGFLGHHIVDLLVERHPSTRVSVLDLRTTANRSSNPNVSYYDGDLTDKASTLALFKKLKPEVVIHTASPHHTMPNEILFKVNVDGTKALLEVAQEMGVKAFVHTSSASVIHDPKEELVNADEKYPLISGKDQPEYYTSTKVGYVYCYPMINCSKIPACCQSTVTPKKRTKPYQMLNQHQVWAESAVLAANRTPSSFLTCAIRPAGIFGEGDVQLLPKMLDAYFKGQHKFQIGENENLFDFTYVRNVAHAHLLAAVALLATHKMLPTIPLDSERVDGEAFLVTNGQPVYFWDFPRQAWKEAGNTLPVEKVWKLSFGTMSVIGGILESVCWAIGKKPNLSRKQVQYSCWTRYYCIDKAKRRLGYTPIVSLEEGIKRGVRYILEQKEQEKKGLAEKKSL